MVGDPPEGVELVGRPSRRSGSGLETLPLIYKWSGDSIGGLEVVGRPFRRFGSGMETVLEVRK